MFCYKLFTFKTVDGLTDFFDSITFDFVIVCCFYSNSKYFLGIRCTPDLEFELDSLVSSYEVDYKKEKR